MEFFYQEKKPRKSKKDEDTVDAVTVKYIEKDEKNRNFDLDNTSDGIPLSRILGWGDTVKEDDVKFLKILTI